tara:strand:+ start:279 stop:812 length:534 start_codon:yes stop_codon:yes gene_type:complete
MEPLTIAASIGVAKQIIASASDLKDCGTALQNLFDASDAHEKNKKNSQPKTRNQQIVHQRLGEDDSAYGDDTSISSVTNDILQEKKNELAIQQIAKEIDRKWGQGTWEAIVAERKRRIQEKENKEKAKKKAIEAKKEHSREVWHKVLIEGGKITVIIAVIGFMAWFLWWAAQRGGSA